MTPWLFPLAAWAVWLALMARALQPMPRRSAEIIDLAAYRREHAA